MLFLSFEGSYVFGMGAIKHAHSHRFWLMLWVLGAALSFSGLCVWMESGCIFPRSGGDMVYCACKISVVALQ